ncbi:MAG: immunoglobulin domain-containing protein [Bacteroidota bacterium]|nr:immunoglobulin domain-containing protein [Bacteroidota bacterium]
MNWETASSWQTWDGSIWTTAVTYPGQNAGSYAVTIQPGHIVTIPDTGISILAIGTLTVYGRLDLTGKIDTNVNFEIKTTQLSISSGGTVYFLDKSTLILPANAVLSVFSGGLRGSCTNNNTIKIGDYVYGNCNGVPGSTFTFDQIMEAGGTFNAISSASTLLICSGNTTYLTGGFSGTTGEPPTFRWSCQTPVTFSPSDTIQSPSVSLTVPGTYVFTLTASTIVNGDTIRNSENISVVAEDLPTIFLNPSSQTVCSGSSVTFSVAVTGTSTPTYQWRKQITNIPGANSSSYTIPSVSASDATWYNVLITNSCAEITSNNAQLILFPELMPGAHNTDSVKACINYNPPKLEINSPATSGGSGSYSYQWYVNGNPVGTDSSSYDPQNLLTAGTYRYNCMVTDDCDNSQPTDQKVINIVPDPTVSISGRTAVCQNESLLLTAVVSGGTGSNIFHWQTSPNGADSWINITGATSTTYSPSTNAAGIFYYRIKITGGAACSQPNASVTITVNPLPTTTLIYHD